MKIPHFLIFLTFFMILTAAQSAHSQEETATREISSLDFQKQRPKTSGAKIEAKGSVKVKKNLAVVSNKQRKYNLVRRIPVKKPAVKITPAQKTQLKTEQLGVTFWRLRPTAEGEEDVPIFPVRIGDRRENWTAERVNSTTRFKIGDRVRFTIESSRSGYLYLINREFYTDGSFGAANLIFPTLRTRSGDNRVSAGTLIDIPSATDSVPYFTIKPKRDDYAGEELIVLITKEPLPFEIGLKALAVNDRELEKWADDWGALVDIYDAADGEGIAITATEFLKSQTNSRALEQEEPLPQTIYKVEISSDKPLLIPFRMQASAR